MSQQNVEKAIPDLPSPPLTPGRGQVFASDKGALAIESRPNGAGLAVTVSVASDRGGLKPVLDLHDLVLPAPPIDLPMAGQMASDKDWRIVAALADGGLMALSPDGVRFLPPSRGAAPMAQALSLEGGLALVAQVTAGVLHIAVVDLATGAESTLPAGPLTLLSGQSIATMILSRGRLSLALRDDMRGFSLWQTTLAPGASWQNRIARGAMRHALNPSVAALIPDGDDLVLCSQSASTSHLALGEEYPEVISLAKDGGWELLSGQPRFTPHGHKRPSAKGGPGRTEFAGLTIGGGASLGSKGDFLIWVTPQGGATPGMMPMRYAAKTGWIEGDPVETGGIRPQSMALLSDGGLLVAGVGAPPDSALDAIMNTDANGAPPALVMQVSARFDA